MSTEAKCPFTHTAAGAATNADWWPKQLNLKMLHQHSPLSDPMDKDFDYAKEFQSLDLNAVSKDLHALMTDSQDWSGCVPTLATMAAYSFGWRGTARARTASATGAVARGPGSSASRRSIAGRTM